MFEISFHRTCFRASSLAGSSNKTRFVRIWESLSLNQRILVSETGLLGAFGKTIMK